MVKHAISSCFLAAAMVFPLNAQDKPKVVPANGKLKVFILAGQSNMVGFGQLKGGPGTMESCVKSNPKAYGHLVDEEGNHVVRDDGRPWMSTRRTWCIM